MYSTPYSTTMASSNANISKVKQALEILRIEGRLLSVSKYPSIKCIVTNDDYVRGTPPFNHPVLLDNNQIVIDLRPFSNRVMINDKNEAVITDGGFVALLLKQAVLQSVWLEDPSLLTETTDLPIQVYSAWVSGSISRRLNLPITIENDIAVLAAWFHMCQYMEPIKKEVDLQATSTVGITVRLSRITYAPAEKVLNLLELVGHINTVAEFVEAVQKLEDRRLSAFNIRLFYTLLSSSWYGGPAPSEVVAISTEYPPYFLSMLHTAINENMYRKTPINEMALRYRRGDSFNRYNKAIANILRSAEG